MPALASLAQPQELLISCCVAGDEAAWASLYDRYAGTIAHFVSRLGVPADLLDDVVQEVFLQAFRSLSNFRGDGAIKTWLYRLAVTQARKSREKTRFATRVRQVLALEGVEEAHYGDQQPCQAERLLKAGLNQLSALEREAFVLYELEGQAGVALAQIFGCPEPTVYRRLHDARRKFQAFVEAEARP